MRIILITMLMLITGKVYTQNTSGVLVLGTLHHYHKTDTNYSFTDIIKILDKYNPDVVCVEIRDQEFRRELYLPEMTLGVLYGVSKGLKTYPIDWWTGTANYNVRTERDSLVKQKNYKKLMKEEERIRKKNKIIQDFENKYGNDYRKLFQKSFLFFNGVEYSDYIREGYKISQSLYRDSPMNLLWRIRNVNMYKKIDDVISENLNKKIVILTGCEHKYFFDDTLKTRKDIRLSSIEDLMPLKQEEVNSSVIQGFLTNLEDSLYFLPGYPKDRDQYYMDKLVPLVHGRDMDEKPEIIPEKNKLMAKGILEKWQNENSRSFNYLYEKGWFYFITKDYTNAINIFEPFDIKIDSLNSNKQTLGINDKYWFVNIMVNRILGMCYDLKGMREKAVLQYTKGIRKINDEATLSGIRKKIFIKILYRNYLKEPYLGW